MLTDFPKIHCPFIRQDFGVGVEDFKRIGNKYKLRSPKVYLVINEVNPGYEWVFEDPSVIAVEKLDGSNVKVKMNRGKLEAVQNRKNVIDPMAIGNAQNATIMEGIFRSGSKGYLKFDGEQAGELVGPKLQGNPYGLTVHEWYPFSKSEKSLKYKSFHEHDRTFENWSSWFQSYLISLFARNRTKGLNCFAEGVIFYSLARRERGEYPYMAKLRRDMFEWFYSDEIQIIGYDKHKI